MEEQQQPNLLDMMNALLDISSEWYEMGLRLGLNPGKLDNIRESYHYDVEKCMIELIKKWLDFFPEGSWRDVVVALVGLGKHALALQVAQKHCKDAEKLVPTHQPPQSECACMMVC